jgi:type II secretory pathway component PulJ
MKLPLRRSDEHSEAGETLIETLLSTALMALVVVGIIGGLTTTVLGSKVHRQLADTNSVLVGVMEHLKSDAVPRVQCAGTSTYQAAATSALPAATDWSGSISYTIQYQTVNGGAAEFQGVCQDDGSSGLTLQLITLTATTDDGNVSPSMSFVKGDY